MKINQSIFDDQNEMGIHSWYENAELKPMSSHNKICKTKKAKRVYECTLQSGPRHLPLKSRILFYQCSLYE